MSLIQRAVDAAFRRLRLGFYHATVSSSPDSFRRQDVDAEWGPTLPKARRISSPILDVVPALGTRLAMLSQDGVPEFAAWIGQVWDDAGTPKAMTAWLRANLLTHPGHLELGATKGIRVRVGSNTIDITPTADGTLEIDATNIKLGSAATQALLKQSFATFFDAHVHTDPVSGTTGPPTILSSAAPPGTYETTKAKGE